MPRTTPRSRRRSESSRGASGWVFSIGVFLSAWVRSVSAEFDSPQLTRLDLGGGHTLRILTVEGRQRGERLGEQVRGAGDVNGDGFAAVLVAAPRWGEALPGHGEVRLYLGCREGLSSEPVWIYRGPRPYAKAGRGLWGGARSESGRARRRDGGPPIRERAWWRQDRNEAWHPEPTRGASDSGDATS